MSFEDTFQRIGTKLTENGFKEIKYKVKLPDCSGRFDIVARSGGLRKKTVVCQVSEDPDDASIAGMLLEGIPKKCMKYIYLISGDPAFVPQKKQISVITKVDDLPAV